MGCRQIGVAVFVHARMLLKAYAYLIPPGRMRKLEDLAAYARHVAPLAGLAKYR
jgi:hypothetical protein